MKIMQGDEYDVMLRLTDLDGEVITVDGVSEVEVVLGPVTKTYSGGEIVYDSLIKQWIFHLTQQETHSFSDALAFQVRVKLNNDDVVGTILPSVFVTPSRSPEVL